MKIKIKKGLELKIVGAVTAPDVSVKVASKTVAIYPDDYTGFIPKACVKEGQHVAAGEALMYNKTDEKIKLVSPVAGTVTAVERGERRHIERIIVEIDGITDNKAFSSASSPDAIVELLAESGMLAMIRRRPFADVPPTDTFPRDIFVTAFDSAPLAVDRLWSDEDIKSLQAGASLLAKVTTGKVYVFSRPGTLPEFKDAININVEGPHPAGLPGIQAAQIRPVNKGETIWTLNSETLWRIGQLSRFGSFDPTTFVAVCGSCITKPYVAHTVIGARVEDLVENNIKDSGCNIRFISGNVLTGKNIDARNDYLRFPYSQITAIPEGDDVDEFMGWASLSPRKMSVSPSYPGGMLKRLYNPDARIFGGRRAMIMSGEYDRVMPMDIMTEFLIKAIQSRNIENMERLGIYEVAPEDFALAEYVCSSKMPLQQIVSEGLEYLKKELQ